ncbi:glycosyl hydrolases family 16 domain-containing protein [Sarocladium implicatum]|nr:glycosyl hydrolases family 16 domain-containing protein [Sarocladium implicatum]
MFFSRTILPAFAALLGVVLAQVTTECNPMEKDDCKPDPAFGTSANFVFNSSQNSALWETVLGPITYDAEKGAAFTLSKQGDSPTIRTKFYFFGGRTDIIMKAAPGKGIVSAMMWLSDNLDEVDWEFIGVNDTHASTNYFGKGVEDYQHVGWHEMSAPQTEYHNYSTLWTKDKLQWSIDGNVVRTLLPKDANDTIAYPQTPMRLSLGIWAGGDPSLPEGTRLWAGGDTDYDAGPYTMYVKEVYVEDFTTGSKEYVFGDRSGSWDSIEVVKGNSTAYEAMHKQPEKTMSEKWEEDVPDTAKYAIYGGGAGVGALLIAGLAFYCIKQRRRGAAEAKAAAQRNLADRAEDARFQKEGINPDAFTEKAQEYSASGMKNETVVTTESYNAGPGYTRDGAGAGAGAGFAAAAGAAAAAGGMRSPVPLLRDGAQSPRVNSPGPMSPYHDGPRSPQSDRHSPGPGMNAGPYRTQSPGLPRSQSPAIRSQTQSPAQSIHGGGFAPMPQNRGSPGPQRMHSPAPMGQPRSFSDNAQSAYGANRMQTASPMNPNRSFSSGQPPYRGPPPQGRDYWNNGQY